LLVRALADRVFINDDRTRSLLCRFAGGHDAKGNTELSNHEASELRELISTKAPWLHEFVQYLDQNYDCKTIATPAAHRLLKALSRISPANGFVLNHATTGPALLSMAEGINYRSKPKILSQLVNNCPAIADVLNCGLFPKHATCPSALRPVLKHVAVMAGAFLTSNAAACLLTMMAFA
jgi:hypothetical protein